MILAICENPETLSTILIVKTILSIIKISVPILLIVTTMIAYVKNIKDNEYSKTNKVFINKIIAAVCIFFLPTLFSIVLNLVWTDTEVNACWQNASSQKILELRIAYTEKLITKLEDDFSLTNYNYALSSAKDINDKTKKEEMVSKVKEYSKYVDLQKRIDKLGLKYNKNTYEKIETEIAKIDNEKIRNKMQEYLESVANKYLSKKAGTYSSSLGNLTYKVYIPDDATVNMPLIMYLHGDGGYEDTLYSSANKVYNGKFPFIIVAPIGGKWAETSGRTANLKQIVDAVCEEYACDQTKISITGHSRGAIGTWAMVNQYPKFFHAAAPVSCGGTISANNFLSTKVLAFCGNKGDDIGYFYEMQSMINAIKSVGGNATLVTLSADHGGTPALAYTKNTFKWMIN